MMKIGNSVLALSISICSNSMCYGGQKMSSPVEVFYFPFSMHVDPPIDKTDIVSDLRRYFEIRDKRKMKKLFSYIVKTNNCNYKEYLTRLAIISSTQKWYFDMNGDGVGPDGCYTITNLSGFEKWMEDTSGLCFNLFSSKFEPRKDGEIETKTIYEGPE